MGNCIATPTAKKAVVYATTEASCAVFKSPLAGNLESDELSSGQQLSSTPPGPVEEALGTSVPKTVKVCTATPPRHFFMLSSSISDALLNGSNSGWQSCEVPAAELLAGIKLTRPLAYGGQGCIFSGSWHGVDRVAVKMVVVRGQSGEALRSPAFKEVLFAKCLSHPHIVRTHDVRTCKVSQEFIDMHMAPADDHSAATPVVTVPGAEQQQQQTHRGGHHLHQQQHYQHQHLQQQQEIQHLDVSLDQSFDSREGFGRNDMEDKAQGLNWPHIIRLTSMRGGDHVAIIVMDMCTMGNLWGAIKKGIFSGSNWANGNGIGLTIAQQQARDDPFMAATRDRALLRTAYEVAMAMHYLHVQDVVHGDIKPLNVLLNGSRQDRRGFTPLLGDFGLSRVLGSSKQAVKDDGAVGTLQYMAPEIHSSQLYSPASDVYAFGILLYEMASGQPAYKEVENREQLLAGVQLWGMRPEWPQDRLPELEEWYLRCVHVDPDQRPTAEQLVDALKRIERRVRYAAHQARAAACAQQQTQRQQLCQQQQQRYQQQQQFQQQQQQHYPRHYRPLPAEDAMEA